MSGHSHFATIKHKKEAEDKKRGKVFSKLSRLISMAAREGKNPEKNTKLKQAIDEARKFNMPNDNIERAIKRGSGEIEGRNLQEVVYEALTPEGVKMIIEGITDNKNRTFTAVKQALLKYKGKIADEGSLKWLFERKGLIILKNPPKNEELELKIIDSGAEDFKWTGEENVEITTKPEELEKVKEKLKKEGIEIESSSLGWEPKEKVEVKNKEKYQNLFEDLLNEDDVQEIYSNIKM